MRRILNGIFYVLRSGGAWRLLPYEYPAWSTVSDYFRKWRNADAWEDLVKTLRERLRVQARRQAMLSAETLDSQSVKGKTWIQIQVNWTLARCRALPAARLDHDRRPGTGLVTLPKSFEALPRGWAVERTIAWIGRSRSLGKNDGT